MRELQAESALLRLRAGHPGALDAARGSVTAIDNPVLAARLESWERDRSAVPSARAAPRRPARVRAT